MVATHDPCGIICIILTYCAVGYADYVVLRWILIQTMNESLWAPVHAVIFNTVILLSVLSHWKAAFSDPGIVPLPSAKLDFSDLHNGNGTARSAQQEEGWTVCLKCETYRPPRAHHCRVCRRCVRRMDHHCPWINNCVGEQNQKYFIQFLLYIGILSAYAAGLVVYSWMMECEGCVIDKKILQHRIVHSVVLVVESGLFGLFVFAIMCDQVQAIFSDTTAVEHIKHEGPRRPRRPKMALMADVFGRGHPLLWLLPCSDLPEARSRPSGIAYEV